MPLAPRRPAPRAGLPPLLAAVLIATCLGACTRRQPAAAPGVPVTAPPTNAPAAPDEEAWRRLVRSYTEETGARRVGVERLRSWLDDPAQSVVLLDVREPEEHAVSALPGARLLPPGEVQDAALEAPPDAEVVTYCTAGYRSGVAARALEERLGRPVHNLEGGIIEWLRRDGKTVRPATGERVRAVHPFGPEWARFVPAGTVVRYRAAEDAGDTSGSEDAPSAPTPTSP